VEGMSAIIKRTLLSRATGKIFNKVIDDTMVSACLSSL
jgi:hypothetical protein